MDLSARSTAATTSPPFAPADDRMMPGALMALLVLFGMNMMNYVDRFVFNAVGPSVMHALELKKYSEFAYLASAFMVVYTFVSPVVGWMGDRYSRRRLLAFGVGLWSVATVGTAFARSYWEMFFWRALLGVGEASYGVVAPPLLADLFPVRMRGRVMGLFYLALPVGGALGYKLGGWIDLHYGWRPAFLAVGLPGLLLALLGLIIPDPGRGTNEGFTAEEASERARFRDYLGLFRVRSYLFNTLGLAAVTFTSGAYAIWGPTFYNQVRQMRLERADHWIGTLTVLAGLLGIAIGMWAPDVLGRRTRRAYLIWAALAIFAVIPFGCAGILDPDVVVSMRLLFVAMTLLASVLGPCNTVPSNVIPPQHRAAAYALNIFLIHILGDISSPILIGHLSGWLGRPSVAGSGLGLFLAGLGARPIGHENLTAGMLIVVPVLILGVVFFLLGARYLPEDQGRAHEHRVKQAARAKRATPGTNGKPP